MQELTGTQEKDRLEWESLEKWLPTFLCNVYSPPAEITAESKEAPTEAAFSNTVGKCRRPGEEQFRKHQPG